MTQTAKTPKVATLNEPLGIRIEKAAWAGLRLQIPGIPTVGTYCLKYARRVVEEAMGLQDRGFYSLVLGEDSDPTAYEIEHLLNVQKPKWVFPPNQIKPGDLLFWPYWAKINKEYKNWGHVGIAVIYNNEFWVAQNTVSHAGIQINGALRLIKLLQMGKPSSVLRIGG